MTRIAVTTLCLATLGFSAITWTATTPLPRASWRHACASTNGYIYFLAGGSGPYADCHAAKVNPDGSLGSWVATTPLPEPLGWFSCEATGNHIYVIGGWNNSGLTSAVRYAPLDTLGNIGAWQATTSLPTNLYTQGGVRVDSFIYVIGGHSGSTIADVRYSRIQPDGSLGDWTATTSLPQALRVNGAAHHNGYIYSVGGRTGFDAENSVYYAKQNPDGSLGPWYTATSLPSAEDGNTATIVGDRLYSVSGLSSSAVCSAEIQPDGSLGAWETETNLPGVRWAADGIAVNGRIYIPGGWYGGTPYSDVYYSSELTGASELPGQHGRPALALTPSLVRPGTRLTLSGLAGPASIRMMDAGGRTRLVTTSRDARTAFSCPELEPGVYFVRVVEGNRTSAARLTVLP